MNQFRLLLILLAGAVAHASANAQQGISLTDRQAVLRVNQAVGNAGRQFGAGDFKGAGKSITQAIEAIDAMAPASPQVQKLLAPAIQRIQKARKLLLAKGVSVASFAKPLTANNSTDAEPKSETMVPSASKPPNPSAKPTPTTPPSPNQGISFTKQVAPILANRCGRCHVSGARGGFSMSSFAKLMTGPPEGVVIFPGNSFGSRLIETIETGDMPRGGGRVTPQELQTLKTWITTGAKFDGNDPDAPLNSGVPTTANNTPAPTTTRATGKETVSFAKDVAGLLVENCNGCHIDAMQTRGGLRMDTFAQLLRGGDSGAIIQPGKGAESLLVKKLRGMEGNRMPAGGRPALPEEQIQLISTWIDEGATLDGANDRQPLRVMNQLAWAASASVSELSSRRAEDAKKNFDLVIAGQSSTNNTLDTPHFHLVGNVSSATMELVGELAEKQLKTVKSIVSGDAGEGFYRGRATVFVLSQRYGYSEFAKMVEQRSLPASWTSHWKYDGIDAYVALVATERDEEDVIAKRLLAPLSALAVATRGSDIPRWFAEGVGTITATRNAKLDRQEKMQLESETMQALTAMKDAKSFLGGKMTPQQSDRIGAAIANAMLDRSMRRRFDQLLRGLQAGGTFEPMFARAFGMTPEAFINARMGYRPKGR